MFDLSASPKRISIQTAYIYIDIIYPCLEGINHFEIREESIDAFAQGGSYQRKTLPWNGTI